MWLIVAVARWAACGWSGIKFSFDNENCKPLSNAINIINIIMQLIFQFVIKRWSILEILIRFLILFIGIS